MPQSPLLGGQLLNGPNRALSTLPPPPPPQIEVTIEADNTVTLQAGSGDATLTVTSPATYAGSYDFNLDQLATGPINLAPPAISGPDPYGMLTLQQGLWVYDAEVSAPALQVQWMQDGTALAGATETTYTAVPDVVDRAITVVETAADSNGSNTAGSAAITVPGITPPTELLMLADEQVRTGTASSFSLPNLALGAEAPTRDIIVVSCLIGGSGTQTTAVQIAGVPATQLISGQSAGSQLVSVSAWQARVPTGATGTVSVTASGNSSRQHVTLYSGAGLTIEDSIGRGGTNSSSLTLPLGTAADGAMLAVVANNNGAVFSWNNIDKLFDVNIGGADRHVSAALRNSTAAETLDIVATHPDNAQLAGVAVSVT